jgi:hypothetical protein
VRDVAGGLAGCEVVEDRVHDLGRRPAQRCRPSGEVGVPVVTQAKRHQRLGRLVRRVRDDPDGLHESEHAACGGA